MPICFIFNYFNPICWLAPSKYHEPPCLCSRADTLHPTMENAGRAEWQSSQQLGETKCPLEHRACRSRASVAPLRFPAGQLTTSAPSAWGHHSEEPKHLHAAHHCPSCAGGQLTCSSARPAAWTVGFRRKKCIPLAIKRSLFMEAGSWIIIFCSPLLFSSPPPFFLINENTPEELSIFFQKFSISLTCSNLHHSSFLVSNCTTVLYLCPRKNALGEGMNWNLSVKGTSRHPRDWHSCYLHVKEEKRCMTEPKLA